MDIFPIIDVDLISILLLIAILINGRKKLHSSTADKITKVFISMIIVTISILVLEIISITIPFYSIDNMIFICKFSNILGFSLIPIIYVLWIFYLKSWVSIKLNYKLFFIPILFNTILCFACLKYPLVFSIDNYANYTRGPLFILPAVTGYIYLLIGLVILIKNRTILDRKEFIALLNFALLPSITAILQLISSDFIIIWSGVTAAIVLFYLFLQERILIYDSLTNAQNRLGFETAITPLFNSSKRNFSMILIDLDHFKSINDNYGHNIGDHALINAVKIFKSVFKDFGQVFRLGGDEFIIIVPTRDSDIIATKIENLNSALALFNSVSNIPYTIKFSYGFDVCDDSYLDLHSYLSHLDILMYDHKKSKPDYLS